MSEKVKHSAGAPDLLEALEVLGTPYRGTLCFCHVATGNPMSKDHSAACISAQKAIAKARGEG